MNFQPVLIPLSTMEESDVDEYLDCYYDSSSDEFRIIHTVHSIIRVATVHLVHNIIT